jgi:hypothetical protein
MSGVKVLALLAYPSSAWISWNPKNPGEKDWAYKHWEDLSDSQWANLLKAVGDEGVDAGFEMARISAQFSEAVVTYAWEARNDASRVQDWGDRASGKASKYLEFLQAWIDGIRLGRMRAQWLGSTGHVVIGYEFTQIDDAHNRDNKWGGPVGISDFQEGLKTLRGIDIWLYSAWQSTLMFTGITPEQQAAIITSDIRTMRKLCEESHQLSCSIGIGEFGLLHTELNSPEALGKVIRAALDEGVEIFLIWVMYNDPTLRAENWGDFGLIDNEDPTVLWKFTSTGQVVYDLLLQPTTDSCGGVLNPCSGRRSAKPPSSRVR